VSLALASRRAALLAPWNRNELWRRARAVPSLDLRFAENRSLVDATTGLDLVTFSRTSDATFVGSNGLIQTASAGTPRFDHNPLTGESLGLLVEEQRANEVRNSNNMSAVVTGSPGTLPTGWSAQGNTGGWNREVVGSGSLGVLNYVDIRFSGTPTTGQFGITFQSQGAVAASNGQSWAPSVYYQLVGGSMSNIGFFPAANLWNSSVAFIGSISIPVGTGPTSTLQRYTGSGTITNATAAFISWGITFTCTVGNTYDFTIRFAGPQLEQGAFATSVIPTSGTAVTRAADVCSISGSNYSSWASNSAFTIFTEAASASGAAYTGHVYIIGASFNDGVIHYRQADSQPVARVRTSGVDEYGANGSGAIWSGSSSNRFALALSSTSGRQASNGLLQPATDDTSIALPAMSSLTIGSLLGFQSLNGHIRRLVYWRERLANNVLQSITQ
jgi:hypothetical protein